MKGFLRFFVILFGQFEAPNLASKKPGIAAYQACQARPPSPKCKPRKKWSQVGLSFCLMPRCFFPPHHRIFDPVRPNLY